MTGFEVKAKGTHAEVYVYDAIGDGFSGVTASGFARELKALGPVKTLDIFVNSPGGSPFDGIAIYNTLRRNPARKRVVVDGLAASAASIVVMSGDEIEIASNGQLMIHDPWVLAVGNAADLRSTADKLDRTKAQLLDVYMTRAKGSEAAVSAMMAAETWMDAGEAVQAGFADRVVDMGRVAALVRPDMLSQFRNTPRALTEPRAPFVPQLHPLVARARELLKS